MSVESTTTIAGLNALWPQGTDVKAEGDDHIRLIKSVLKAEFPTGSAGTVIATAQARNRIINPALQVSQENGNNAGTVVPTFYVADQWATGVQSTGTITGQRVQVVTPNGSINRARMTVTVADTSLTTSEGVNITQFIEGQRMADFRYGSASAKQSILRFGFKGPAGTYSVAIRNAVTATRSYIVNFTIAAGQANTDTEQTFVIPGDTGGVWAVDNGTGVLLSICVAGGPSAVGVAGWQGGNLTITSSNTNGLATAGAVYELFDVGWYLDPNATGKAPAWVMPDEAEELAVCMRYWQVYGSVMIKATGNDYSLLFAPMRVIPAISGGGPGFNTVVKTINHMLSYQTSANFATLALNARM